VAGFNPSVGNRAPTYIIPPTVPFFLYLATNTTGGAALPAPSPAASQFQCSTSTGFQQDSIVAQATGINYKRQVESLAELDKKRHLYALSG
jgi:hypothetical protein